MMREMLTRRFSKLARDKDPAEWLGRARSRADRRRPRAIVRGVKRARRARALRDQARGDGQGTRPQCRARAHLSERPRAACCSSRATPCFIASRSSATRRIALPSAPIAPGARRRCRPRRSTRLPGIGPTRKRALLQHFGSAKAVSRAGIADLDAVGGISAQMAKTIYDHFHEGATLTDGLRHGSGVECHRRHARRRARFWSLPNLLTYGRIIAIPALVACFFVTGDWGRWTAMWIFIAAGVSDFLDGYLARAWQQQSAIGRMLDPDRRQADRGGGAADARRRSDHRRLVAVGRRDHPLPRDPGVGLARISRLACRRRSGDAARQMEDRGADGGDRLSAGRQRRRQDLALHHAVRPDAVVDRRACSRSIPATIICRAALRHVTTEEER